MLESLPDSPLKQALERVAALSPFFSDLVARNELLAAAALKDIDVDLDAAALVQRYHAFIDADPAQPLAARLRQLRQREMIRIIFRDLSRRANLFATTFELSQLADFCIETALADCYGAACEKYGTPVVDGIPEKLIVLGMGKLGAYELNLSSDIDLIFLYSNQGQILRDDGSQLSFQEFFLRLARQVIACLDNTGSIDRVFRVDMRLRPYGDSGPLVLHRAAMEKYYLEQGRDWERYAFIKARVVAGDLKGGRAFLDWMKPFVFRRHLDFGSIQSLREMKALIRKQVELKEMGNDLKLGPGGIREIEFIAQAHQLIWGGRYLELQQAGLKPVLEALVTLELLPAADQQLLSSAYVFLRNSEHAIQAEHDRQTHALPENEISRARLAVALGFETYDAYLKQLDHYRQGVSACFDQLIAERAEETSRDVDPAYVEAWQAGNDRVVSELREDIVRMNLTDEVRTVLDRLMPCLMQHCAVTDEPLQTLHRMLAVVRAVLRRSTYLVFLDENPDALQRAVTLVDISTWIADQLAAYPIGLYGLTDRSMRAVSVTRRELEGELREHLRTVEIDDLETRMDTLRQFKLSAMLKIAAMELLDQLSIMEASDGLTALAEVLLEASCDMAWHHLEAKHGLPCDVDGQPLNLRMAIVAYGKAGGLELAYGSDLDLVFLGPDDIRGSTDGSAPVNNNVFFVRLGQRVIHILTSFTRFGVLYEADLRLRPQGNKGPLVATLNAFARYQAGEAWTWEHQALVRARFVAGDVILGQRFEAIRASVLQTARDRSQLLQEVLEMRQRMREHLSSETAVGAEDRRNILGRFDLKHDTGAIVDIEFMVQYAVLGWASQYPVLSRWTDVMRLLDELSQTGIYSEEDTDALQRAYLAFRAAVHHEWLGLPTNYERLQNYREQVERIWNNTMLITDG